MGKTLLILIAGVALSFGILSMSKDRRYLDALDQLASQVSAYSASNAATSGAYMALNQIYLDPQWRNGYTDVELADELITVRVEDNQGDPALDVNHLRIVSSGRNSKHTRTTRVILFDGSFKKFAIWCKEGATNVSTKDSLGNLDASLMQQFAPFMPRIDDAALLSMAQAQEHVATQPVFEPASGYPNGSFYFSGATPNVTHVQGNLYLMGGRTVYGIFIVDGNATLEGSSRLRGVLYMPNPTSTIIHGGGNPSESSITGGILTWGSVNGTGNHISVRHAPEFLRIFADGYSSSGGSIQVLSWEQN